MKRLIAFAAGFLLVGSLMAQVNTTPATAPQTPWGQTVLTNVNSTTPTQFWFLLHVEINRSYCVETGHPDNSVFGDKDADTVLTVYLNDTTTVVTTNNDASADEPVAHNFSRACFIPATGNTDYYVKVTPNGTVPSAVISIRFLETTMFCPWFFIAGDYNAFSLIRNTSKNSLSGVVVNWRGLSGTIAGTTTVTVPANGTVILNARDFVNSALFSNGSVEIAHTGSPQRLMGSTTTLSGTTGLGFDAMFEQRKPW